MAETRPVAADAGELADREPALAAGADRVAQDAREQIDDDGIIHQDKGKADVPQCASDLGGGRVLSLQAALVYHVELTLAQRAPRGAPASR